MINNHQRFFPQDTFLTLFKKEDIPTATPPNTPEILTRIILSSKVEISYHELKRCYSTALFFVKQEVELFRYYILALSMKMLVVVSANLTTNNSPILRQILRIICGLQRSDHIEDLLLVEKEERYDVGNEFTPGSVRINE